MKRKREQPPWPVELLCRRWIHSHEEDSATETVYRPAEFPFPPSRGRKAVELREDGTYSQGRPGPVDRKLESGGTWEFQAPNVILFHPAEGNPPPPLNIQSVDQQRLVVARST